MSATELQRMAAANECLISIEAAEQILDYLGAMLAENRNVNLTAIREPSQGVLLHALDSIAIASEELGLRPPSACLDLGTGNGFPGVVVACLFPDAEVTLMDRTLKKLKAIERALVAAELASDRIRTVQMDAAAAPAHGHKAAYDLVTARAVGDARSIGRLARPMLRPGGSFVIWMSDEQRETNKSPGAYQAPRYVEYELPPPVERWRTIARFTR